MVDFSTLQCYGVQATLVQEQLNAVMHCLYEESTVEGVTLFQHAYWPCIFFTMNGVETFPLNAEFTLATSSLRISE